MANFHLENSKASIRCTVFPKAYAECRRMIMDGAIALVKGKIKADGNSVELRLAMC